MKRSECSPMDYFMGRAEEATKNCITVLHKKKTQKQQQYEIGSGASFTKCCTATILKLILQSSQICVHVIHKMNVCTENAQTRSLSDMKSMNRN